MCRSTSSWPRSIPPARKAPCCGRNISLIGPVGTMSARERLSWRRRRSFRPGGCKPREARVILRKTACKIRLVGQDYTSCEMQLVNRFEERLMALTLYAHPFSSYCQKVLIALYENTTPFAFRQLGPEDATAGIELAKLWPLNRFPVLVDGDLTLPETSIIIEHLALHHPGPVKLIPEDPDAALQVRLLDRFFDNYIMTPMQKIVLDARRPAESRDPYGVNEARNALETAYAWLEQRLTAQGQEHWIAGNGFSLADCAAAPSLF